MATRMQRKGSSRTSVQTGRDAENSADSVQDVLDESRLDIPRTPSGKVRPRDQCPKCRGTRPRKSYCWCERARKLGRKVKPAPMPKKTRPRTPSTTDGEGRLTPRERYTPLNVGPRPKPDPAAEYASLGAPPEDPLAATAWVHEALVCGLHHIIRDTDMSEKDRRKEMREQARVLKDLVPQRDLHAAAALVRGEVESLTKGDGPEMTDAPKLNRKSRSGKTRRGRPRKR